MTDRWSEYETEQDSEKVPGVSVTATYTEGESEEQFKIAPAVKLTHIRLISTVYHYHE